MAELCAGILDVAALKALAEEQILPLTLHINASMNTAYAKLHLCVCWGEGWGSCVCVCVIRGRFLAIAD